VIRTQNLADLNPRGKNPVGPQDTLWRVHFDPPASGITRLNLYNAAGELIGQRLDASSAGIAEFDVRGLASGTYICVLSPQGGPGPVILKIAMLR
jgi:hypothetical protein